MSIKAKLTQGGDGTEIPAGFVGEVKTANATSVTASGYNAVNTICSLSLEAGSWLLFAQTDAYYTAFPTGSGAVAIGFSLYNSTDASTIANALYTSLINGTPATYDSSISSVPVIAPISISGTKTIQFRIHASQLASGTGTPAVTSRTTGKFYAIRIA